MGEGREEDKKAVFVKKGGLRPTPRPPPLSFARPPYRGGVASLGEGGGGVASLGKGAREGRSATKNKKGV